MKIRKSTQKNKKYMVMHDGKWIHFGDARYGQYKDSSPLKLYAHLDHGDETRRRRYYQRHGPSNDKNSAKYWAHRFLW